eukprot:g32034.t1
MPNFLSRLRKKRHCYAFLTEASTCEVQDRLLVIITLTNPLHFRSVDVDGGVFSSFLSEVSDQFFSFANVEGEVVITAPRHQTLYLPSVFRVIVV